MSLSNRKPVPLTSQAGQDDPFIRMAEMLSDGVLLVNRSKVILYANPAACRQLGMCVGVKLGSVFDFEGKHSEPILLSMPENGKVAQIQISRTELLWQGEPTQILILHNLNEQHPQQLPANGQEMLSTLVNNLPGLAYRCNNDEQWSMTYVSRGSLELTGYAPEDFMGPHPIQYMDLVHEGDRQFVIDMVREGLSQGRPYQMVYRLVNKSGKVRWVWEQGQGIYTPQGEAVALEGFITDITVQKEAEQALVESEQRYRSLVDTSPDAVILLDLEYRIVACSQWAARLADKNSTEDMVGRKVLDFVLSEDRLHVVRGFQRSLKQGEICELEYRIPGIDKKVKQVEVRVSTIHGVDGEPRAYTLIIREVTERKLAEQALRSSEARYRAIVEDNPELICRFDAAGRLTFANEAFYKFFSLSREQILGKVFTPPVPTEDEPTLRQTLAGLKPDAPPVTVEHRVVRADGEIGWLRWTCRAVVDETGRFLEFQVVGMDITGIVKAEAALRDSERRLRDLLENVKLIAIILNNNGEVVFANSYFLELTGWNTADLAGKNWFDSFTISSGGANVKQVFEESVSVGILPARFQYSIITRSNEQRLISWNNTLLRNHRGEIIGMASIGEDITERRWVEQVQSAIYQIAQAANAANDLQDLFGLIHNILSELMPVKNFFIALYDPDSDLLSFPYFQDEYDPPPKAKHPSRGLTEYVLRTGQSLLASPEVFNLLVAQEEVESVGAPSVDWLGVPLKIEDRIIGVMVTQTYTEGVRFSPRHEQIMRFVSNQVAMAIDRKRGEDAQRVSQERYQTLVEASTDAIFLESLDGRVLDCNSSACRMYGYTRDELLRLRVADLIAADTRQILDKEAEQIATVGSFLNLSKGLRKDGSVFPTEVSGRNIVLSDQPLKVVYVRDITERIAAEAALRESEENFRQLAQTTAAGIFIYQSSKFLYVNPAWEAITGYSSAELLKMDFWSIVVRGEQDRFRQRSMAALRGENVESRYEVCIRTKQGEERWLDVSAALMEYKGKLSILGTAIDITDRRRSEERLRLQSAALQAAANAIVITNPAGQIIFVNQAFTWLTEYPQDEVMGQNTRILRSGRQDDEFYKQMWEMISSGQVWHGELVNRRKDGSLYTEEMTITPVRNKDDEIVNYIAIKQDITYRKQHEQELEAIVRVSAALRTAITRAEIMPAILHQISDLLRADGVLLSTLDERTGEIVIDSATGHWAGLAGKRMPADKGVSGMVIRTGQLYVSLRAATDPNFAFPGLLTGIASLACVPLIAQGRTIGAVVVGLDNPIEDEQLRLLIAISDIGASAIHRADLFETTRQQAVEVEQAYDATIEGWAHALELRDKETQGHTRRVTTMTLKLAHAFHLPESEMVNLRRGALLHDIGKVGVPDAILFKTGPLNSEEWTVMRRHPQYAYDMLSSIEYLRPALIIPYYHHERWNGQGYPFGLSGTDIPLAARIFAVIDVWDALTSDRPYRRAWSEAEARQYILEQSGFEFDPDVVRVFLELQERGELNNGWH